MQNGETLFFYFIGNIGEVGDQDDIDSGADCRKDAVARIFKGEDFASVDIKGGYRFQVDLGPGFGLLQIVFSSR